MRLTKRHKESLIETIIGTLDFKFSVTADEYVAHITKLIEDIQPAEVTEAMKWVENTRKDLTCSTTFIPLGEAIGINCPIVRNGVVCYESHYIPVIHSSVVINLFKQKYGVSPNIAWRSNVLKIHKTKRNMDYSFAEFVNKNFLIPQTEYASAIADLRATIEACSTDKQLADMYPDFVQYFDKAGITVKTNLKLPAIYGLPEKLKQFGWKGNTDSQNTTTQALEEFIKEDIQEGKH